MRGMTEEDLEELMPKGIRLHERPEIVLPDQLDDSRRARVDLDESPITREHRESPPSVAWMVRRLTCES